MHTHIIHTHDTTHTHIYNVYKHTRILRDACDEIFARAIHAEERRGEQRVLRRVKVMSTRMSNHMRTAEKGKSVTRANRAMFNSDSRTREGKID